MCPSSLVSLSHFQELKFDPETKLHVLDALPENVDIGKYTFTFEVLFLSIIPFFILCLRSLLFIKFLLPPVLLTFS